MTEECGHVLSNRCGHGHGKGELTRAMHFCHDGSRDTSDAPESGDLELPIDRRRPLGDTPVKNLLAPRGPSLVLHCIIRQSMTMWVLTPIDEG